MNGLILNIILCGVRLHIFVTSQAAQQAASGARAERFTDAEQFLLDDEDVYF